MNLLFYSCILVFVSFLIFLKFYNHLLLMLISMEFLVVNMILLIVLVFGHNVEEVYFIYFTVFSICDSVIGLSLLILMLRFYGNEYSKILNMTMW